MHSWEKKETGRDKGQGHCESLICTYLCLRCAKLGTYFFTRTTGKLRPLTATVEGAISRRGSDIVLLRYGLGSTARVFTDQRLPTFHVKRVSDVNQHHRLTGRGARA